jgi:hypothetical protein
MKSWLLDLLVVLVLTCRTCFGALGSYVGSCHQKQNRDGGKAQSGQYMVGWAELLHHPIKKKHKVQFSTNPIPKDEI